MAPYRERIVERFYPKRKPIGDLKLAEARKAIREYQKATGSAAGTAELLLVFVENGAKFSHDYGDMGGPFYRSMESALYEFAKLLFQECPELYPVFSKRLSKLEHTAQGIGWGFSDSVAGVVGDMASELG